MPCEHWTWMGQEVIVCTGPPMTEVRREQDGDIRWCFNCRKRREFHYVVDAPTVPSYYGASQRIECGVCGTRDGDLFPGRERECVDA